MQVRRRPTSWWGKNSSRVPGSCVQSCSTGKSSKSRFGISILLEPSGVQWKHLPGSHPITLCGNSLRKQWMEKKNLPKKWEDLFTTEFHHRPTETARLSFKRSPIGSRPYGATRLRSVAYFRWDHCVGNPWQRLFFHLSSSASVYIYIYIINCALNTICT